MKRNHKKQLKSKNYLQNQIKPLVKYPLCNKKTSKETAILDKCKALNRKTNILLVLNYTNIIDTDE